MRIDKPTCMYGERNCRKHFDGNCTVENDFKLRCPIERTINEVLEIINGTIWDDERMQIERAWNGACRTIKEKVLALKGEQE